ncbi:coiled-coil domain-containing protein 177-like isoform X2 [Eriocheir sinensis]|uniref:coiled-coil domain-containing protein 177-like isoform X2 n=1 Tax=Eriocheir sinensis TaxID=95602 RepID=UPI0021C64DC9|nr:coiled-coil domain-containing protein 177-like isoform X2 [Eriocheir sinensis]
MGRALRTSPVQPRTTPPPVPLPLTPLTLRRRPSDTSPSPTSSLSDAAGGGDDSDDGSRSANSAAECDRQGEEDDHSLPRPRSPSPGRLPPRLPVVSVVPCWSPRSDTTSVTSTSTPRLPRRQPTPTPSGAVTGGGAKKGGGAGGGGGGGGEGGGGGGGRHTLPKGRKHSTRPASATHHLPHYRPPPTLAAARSLDQLAGPRREGATGGGGFPHDVVTPRRAMSAASCRSHRPPRPSSALTARSPGPRRGDGGGGGGGGGEGPCWSPRLLPHHRSVSTVSLADSSILAKFMDGLENTQLPARDVRLLELLAMKHEKLFEERQRSQQAHRAWLLQKERDTKMAASEWAAWRAQVNDKRRRENDENLRRWHRLEEVFRQSQENLASLITGKEERARELLTLQRQARARRVEERRSAESARKAAQEAALRAREEAEEQKRQHLIQLWEQQQRLVEQRRREREEFFKRRVAEDNLAETEQQEERRRQVEARGEALLAAMRHNMEERLARAEANLRLLNEAKEDALTRQRNERDRRVAAVQALHNQLEASMMQWRQHILSRQLEAMAAAETRQEQYLRSRANRIYAERSSRHVHHHHLLQQVLAREEAELAMAKRCLEAKDTRAQELARERERQVAKARSTAHTTAALRENLRKKLAPETFDKVVARANLELRIENRPPATSSQGTRSHIFLG